MGRGDKKVETTNDLRNHIILKRISLGWAVICCSRTLGSAVRSFASGELFLGMYGLGVFVF